MHEPPHRATAVSDDDIARVLAGLPAPLFSRSDDPHSSSASRPPRETVAEFLRALQLNSTDRVLQIGGGSGLISAALGRLVARVHVVERVDMMTRLLRRRMAQLGLGNVQLDCRDGRGGLPEQGPYDAILISASAVAVDAALLSQLADGGRLVDTEGPRHGRRDLVRWRKVDASEPRRQVIGRVRISRDIGDTLIELGLTEEGIVNQARVEARAQQRPLEDIVMERAQLDEGDVYRAMARHRGLAHAPISELLDCAEPTLAEAIPRAFLDHKRMLPVGRHQGQVRVATTDPYALPDEIAVAFGGEEVRLFLVTPTDFRRLWSAINLQRSQVDGDATELEAGPRDLLETDPSALEAHAVKLFESLLLDAISERASDIHLEQYGNLVRVRLRIDGELSDQERYELTPTQLSALVNVIKVRSQLDIAERRLPQGGRISLRAGEERYDLRVQTQPSLHAEHVVIRLLPQNENMLQIDQLGFPEPISRPYRRLLDSPSGMVLVVGPTGSGKSTTLYAGLQVLARDARRKVITVEDPIEYSMAGIQQTQVHPAIGFSFARAMRSFVREDPDVILVGEIRDGETALEAIRASQTGHLVLSTLHCNDAVDAVQRLYDLGMHPNSIASELLAVFSQRLARKICTQCRVQAEPDPELVAELYPSGPPEDFECFIGKGCKSCGGRGVRGRVAIGEFMPVNADIRRAIAKQPALDDLRELARGAGLRSLRTSLLEHVRAGRVPLAEARRLLQAEAMGAED